MAVYNIDLKLNLEWGCKDKLIKELRDNIESNNVLRLIKNKHDYVDITSLNGLFVLYLSKPGEYEDYFYYEGKKENEILFENKFESFSYWKQIVVEFQRIVSNYSNPGSYLTMEVKDTNHIVNKPGLYKNQISEDDSCLWKWEVEVQ
jgi:hypothetical protein